MQKWNIAVVGATGAVGEQMLAVLDERNFPIDNLRLLASERSAGETLVFRGHEHRVELLTEESFEGIDIVLSSAGGKVSERFLPAAAAAGAVSIDNTSAFRMEPDVPLVVPEVNAKDIAGYTARRIIANPNCSTIQMVVALAPLHRVARIRRVVVSTYQSVSGAGRRAMEELASQSVAMFNSREPEKNVFPHPIAFNCLPQIDVFLANAYTREEMKMVRETRKIMGVPNLAVTATCVRVPVFSGHSESVNVEFEQRMTPEMAREILAGAEGVTVIDDPEKLRYPLAKDCVGKDDTFVGRIRRDESVEHGLDMWIVADNLRKGAATNAVQIAEILAQRYLGAA
ncbi:aspartate-semialdehyde dehydrogenase [bacterium]|nr:aspartate-semialdehyde dehydrogenase [bacterium]